MLFNKIFSLFGGGTEDKHLSELMRGSSVALALRVAGIGSAYIFTLLVTRGYGAEAMGIFALCLTIIQISAVVGRLGLDSALLRFVAEYSALDRKDLVKSVYAKALRMAIPSGLILSIALFLSAPYLAEYVFNKQYLTSYFRLAAVAVLPMVLVYLHSEGLRGRKKIREYVFLQFVGAFFFAAIILGAVFFFYREADGPLAAFVAGVIIVAGISIIAWRKYSGTGAVTQKGVIRAKDILSVSVPMLLASSLMFIMQWTDTVMLGMWKSEVEVGVYAVAVRIALLTTITLVAINSIAAPKFAEFYGRGDMEGLGRVARQSTKMIFWTSFPVLAVIFLFPSFILGIFGPEFRAGVYALFFLTFGQFVNAASGAVGYILQMTGKQRVFHNIILLATAINIVLNAILIPRYGMNGAAFASMVSIAGWNLGAVIYVRSRFNFSTIYFPLQKT